MMLSLLWSEFRTVTALSSDDLWASLSLQAWVAALYPQLNSDRLLPQKGLNMRLIVLYIRARGTLLFGTENDRSKEEFKIS